MRVGAPAPWAPAYCANGAGRRSRHQRVTNRAINNLDDQVDLVITHKDLTDCARRHAPHAQHISLTNFLDNALYQELVQNLSLANAANDDVANPQLLVAANDDSYEAAGSGSLHPEPAGRAPGPQGREQSGHRDRRQAAGG